MQVIKVDQNFEQFEQIVDFAVQILKHGGVVVYPTETCYGIGVDSANMVAVAKLIKYKGDRKGKPISVAVCDEKMAHEFIEFNPTVQNLFTNFLPGPITVVAQGKHKVDSRLESDDGKLGIRFPKHDIALKIIKKFGKPITATSANISHGKIPYDVQKDLLDRISEEKRGMIDLVVDVGVLPSRPPSTIVDTTLNEPKVLRQGEFVFTSGNCQEHESNSVDETVNFASQFLISNFKFQNNVKNIKCLIIALQGELGAGKTQFAKGVGKALGIKANIKSPTFILCGEYNYELLITNYKFKGKLFHIDTWRMESDRELYEIGFNEMVKPGNVIVIEWGEKVGEILKEIEKRKDVKIVRVRIERMGENERKILTNTN